MVVFFRNGPWWHDWRFPMDLFHLRFPYIPVTWRYTACWYRQRVVHKPEWLSGCSVGQQGGHANDSMELLALHSLGMLGYERQGTKLTSARPSIRDARLCCCWIPSPGSEALVGLAMECTETCTTEGICRPLETRESINPANCPHYSVLKIPGCLPLWMQRSSHLQFVSEPGIWCHLCSSD